VPLRENGAAAGAAMAGVDRRSLEAGLERHGALRETPRRAVAAVRYRPDRPRLRARLCRFPLSRLRLAQGLSEARCLPRKNADAAFGQGFGAAARITLGLAHACEVAIWEVAMSLK